MHNTMHAATSGEVWEILADLLRDELQEYGEFLVLLDEQQQAILEQDAETLRELESDIQQQIQATQQIRNRRTELITDAAQAQNMPADSSVKSLLPSFPQAAQPMIEALINEINALIGKTRNTLRQNHMLLSRASEVTQKVLTALNPNPTTKTYEKTGAVAFKTSSVGSCIRTSA